jgi:GH15 family glucan-1,4-alpha-glucosidase
MSETPIADHALLSDCHGAALVDRSGSVEWWCPTRFDDPSVFGRLLDARAGHLRIGPKEPAEVSRSYLDGSLVLDTRFTTASGVVHLSDALLMGEGVRGHALGIDSPHVLARRATCIAGEMDLEVHFEPRFEYGLTTPLIHESNGALVARGGPTTLVLSGSPALELDGSIVTGSIHLQAGESAGLAVQHASSWGPTPTALSAAEIDARIEDTIAAWGSWQTIHQRYDGPYAELVLHSGRVLQGLTYQPTGAIVAAPTTSLPEAIGADRNWDYRYTWVRDASFTLDALWVAACPDEAGAFLSYLTTAASSVHERRELQIMFSITGERDLAERTIPMDGWRDSRPVRVGNAAWRQRQIDVYGELLAAAHRLRSYLVDMHDAERRFLIALADAAATLWDQPDQGIWEIRGEPRHYLYSKLMCWVALDRAIDLADLLDAHDRVDSWATTRDQIREAIEFEGWNAEVGAFTQAFGSRELDASSLVIPLVGFLPGTDARVGSTIEAVDSHLTDRHGLVYRYRSPDGLTGDEGTFLLCTFWLSQALALAGETRRAREVFERATAFCSDLGLLAEQVDPATGEQLGNFPQAFSHIGLINAAWAIGQAAEE